MDSSLEQIITTANETGRDFCAQGLITHRAATGTVRLRATQGGYLVFEIWHNGNPPIGMTAIGLWDHWLLLEGRDVAGAWAAMQKAEIKEGLFFERARELLGKLEAVWKPM